MSNPREHHYVPRFLLAPWTVSRSNGQRVLRGYYWDRATESLRCKESGPRHFCKLHDLLSLKTQGLRSPNLLESRFFQAIDNLGARARDKILKSGPDSLSGEERCDFARLLLSLDARRPPNIAKLIAGSVMLASALDESQEIITELTQAGIAQKPSEFYSENVLRLEDESLLGVQTLVENPEVGKQLINAYWAVMSIPENCRAADIGDRPLIRYGPYNKPQAAWILPLTPWRVFVATNTLHSMIWVHRLLRDPFVRHLNADSAMQCDRYVFSINAPNQHRMGKHLRNQASWAGK